jgi:hypothetical protein
MIPPYKKQPDRPHGHSAGGLVPSDMPYRTTYRCLRMGCAITFRLLNPIDRCPRCGATMAMIKPAQLDLDEFVASSMADVVAGFDALLRRAA